MTQKQSGFQMNNKLADILANITQSKYATDTGRRIHRQLQHIKSLDATALDNDLIRKISENPEIAEFFTAQSMTEVPIAGNINGRFVSRRIDRILINDTTHEIKILDYKTDSNTSELREKYIAQIMEYVALVRDAYPGYNVHGYVLWLHDFRLEQIS